MSGEERWPSDTAHASQSTSRCGPCLNPQPPRFPCLHDAATPPELPGDALVEPQLQEGGAPAAAPEREDAVSEPAAAQGGSGAEEEEDDDDDENETCGFCIFMKGGGCKQAFNASAAARRPPTRRPPPPLQVPGLDCRSQRASGTTICCRIGAHAWTGSGKPAATSQKSAKKR